ncbi:hypothetical protein QZH41_000679 [Actinostola sp. cb2023]|nr:hypothetical protein QZH41_000679 [Actinostola sp. cb2023]
MPVSISSNLTANNSSNHSDAFDYLVFCTEYLNIRQETPVETNLKLTAYTVAFVLAVIGNILIIAIVLRKSHFKTTTNLFIINMAFSDVMMAFVCMPTTMYTIATKNIGQSILTGTFGIAICKVLPFLQGLSIAVSILTLTTLAADRFLAIVYPFRNFISKSRSKLLIAAVWIVGGCFNAPSLYAMTLYEENDRSFCFEKWAPHFDETKASQRYTIVLFVFLYAIPLMLITFFYAALIRELWQGSRHHSNQTRAFSENKSVLKMVLTVVIIFAVCWLPLHVIFFVIMFTEDRALLTCGLKPSIVFMGWFMGHVNSAINPVIYFVFNDSFRREILNMLGGMYQHCLRKRLVLSDGPLPGSRNSTTRQTHAVSISSNEDKSGGKNNDAFEMNSQNEVPGTA